MNIRRRTHLGMSFVLLVVIIFGSYSPIFPQPMSVAAEPSLHSLAQPEPPVEALSAVETAVQAPIVDPDDTCTFPLYGHLGEDNELLAAPWHGFGATELIPIPAWRDSHLGFDPLQQIQAGTTASLAAMGTEQTVMVYRSVAENRLRFRLWNAVDGWTDVYDAGATDVQGNPVVVARSPREFAIFYRTTGNTINYREFRNVQAHISVDSSQPWQAVPGVADVQHDLAAASRDSDHYALTYIAGAERRLMFQELSLRNGWLVQPVAINQSAVQAVNIFARDNTHLMVAAVNTSGQLHVREWSTAHAQDWSDTPTWTRLLAEFNLALDRPAMTSRFGAHLALAVRDQNQVGHFIEATFLNGAAEWKSAVNLGDGVASGLTMVAYNPGKLAVYAATAQGALRERVWTEEQTWLAWDQRFGANTVRQLAPAVAVTNLDELQIVTGHPTNNALVNAWLNHVDRPLSERAVASSQAGVPGGQTLMRAVDKTFWVAAQHSNTGRWSISVADPTPGTNNVVSSLELDHDSSSRAAGRVALLAQDMDRDGIDEVVVLTSGDRQINLSLLRSNGGALAVISTMNIPEPGESLSVAVGDFDGDGNDNEIVTSYAANKIAHQRLYVYQNGTLTFNNSVYDFPLSGEYHAVKVAAGNLDSKTKEDEIVLLSVGTESYSASASITSRLQLVSWSASQPAKQLTKHDTARLTPSLIKFPVTSYYIGLIVDDVRLDGVDEIIAAIPYQDPPIPELNTSSIDLHIYRYSDGQAFVPAITKLDTFNQQFLSSQQLSLGAGDLDRDGVADVVVSTENRISVGKVKPSGHFSVSSSYTPPNNPAPLRTILIGDLDNDSFRTTRVRCNTVEDAKVIAVLNTAPRYYASNQPVQGSETHYAVSKSQSNAQERSWTTRVGGSITLGWEVEQSIPILGTKITGNTGGVTLDASASISGAAATETSVRNERGYEGDEGLVVLVSSQYQCAEYEAFSPKDPSKKTKLLSCTPATRPIESVMTVQDWHASQAQFANSWVPNLGRTTNAITDTSSYPVLSNPPVNVNDIEWQADTPIRVRGSTSSNISTYWSTSSSSSTSESLGGGFDMNLTVANETNISGFVFGWSLSAGGGAEWSSSTTWSDALELGGSVTNYNTNTCVVADCIPYDVVPYVARKVARTQSGLSYPYLELDYYVPCRGSCGFNTVIDPPVQSTPAAPLVTSSTHPDQATWYASAQATLNWTQPATDTAPIAGYRWQIDQFPHTQLANLQPVLTNTVSYSNLPQGISYLHIAAVGNDGSVSPVVHYAINVDTTAPLVELVFDPPTPDGYNGWYVNPVTATVVVSNTPAGANVTQVEFSQDGVTWMAYTEALSFVTETAGSTLWARARDGTNNISMPVSTTLRIDMSKPDSVDVDGFGLSYASFITHTTTTNSQIVLGGALTDTLSGRQTMEINAGNGAQWQSSDAVGEFPMPADNLFTSTATLLNWFYTPTFEIRGEYALFGRGVDQAGNREDAYELGTYSWYPDANPDYSESYVSVAPQRAAPGETVKFTVAARNSGFQESSLAITTSLPLGVTLVPNSITGGGVYHAATRSISWDLHAVWPGEVKYFFFEATVDPGVSAEVIRMINTNLVGYWPGLTGDSEFLLSFETTSSLTLLPVSAGATIPVMNVAKVWQGQTVNTQDILVYVQAAGAPEAILIKEWAWDTTSADWQLQADSGWRPFTTTASMDVYEDEVGRYGWVEWNLSQGDGVKYLGVWVAHANGHVTNLNEGNLIHTNVLSSNPSTISAGQRVQYRFDLNQGEAAAFNLVSSQGAGEVYVWKPRNGLRADYVGGEADQTTGALTQTASFYAPETGTYIVEVEAKTSLLSYHLTRGTELVAQVDQSSVIRPENPLTRSTPFRDPSNHQVPAYPVQNQVFALYLPVVRR